MQTRIGAGRPWWRTRSRDSTQDNHALNALRALAAFAVAVGHLRAMFFQDYDAVPHTIFNAVLYGVTGLGHTAVIVFFVLSGYWVGGGVLTRIGRDRFSYLDYAARRLTRLWVVLLPALLLTAVLDIAGRAWFPGSTVYRGGPGFHVVGPQSLEETLTLRGAIGNLLFLQDLYVPPFGTNTPLWSLAYEFWYYAMFPALVLALKRSGSTRLRVTFALAFLLGCAVTGIEVMALFPVWLLGAAVAYRATSIQGFLQGLPPATLAFARLVSSAVLGAVVLGVSVARIDARLAEAVVGLATAGLVALLIGDVQWRGAPNWILRTTSSYAHASYSLYAIHLPVIVILSAALVGRAPDRWQPDFAQLAAGSSLLCGVVLIARLFAGWTEFRTERIRAALLRRGRVPEHHKPAC
jgi:peptidoglycan/LPS O-acetylase OafA/YrhL